MVDPKIAKFQINKRKIPTKKEYLSSDCNTATHAYICILQRKHKLSPLFKGPFVILDRNPRSMLLDINGTTRRISYLHIYPINFTPETNNDSTSQVIPSHKRFKNIFFPAETSGHRHSLSTYFLPFLYSFSSFHTFTKMSVSPLSQSPQIIQNPPETLYKRSHYVMSPGKIRGLVRHE